MDNNIKNKFNKSKKWLVLILIRINFKFWIMITIKSPLRITFGGGGTDLPSFYNQNGGFLISATINKYIYINLYRPFKNYIFLKYSNYKKVKDIKDIKHPIKKKLSYRW